MHIRETYVLNDIKTYPKYLYYHLLRNWKKRNQDKQFGSATNYIRMGNFTDYDVPVPSLPTQQKIVSKIEELFSELDKGIEQLKTAQQQLKTYRQSVLESAFKGLFTKDWRARQLDKKFADQIIKQVLIEKNIVAKNIGYKLPAIEIADEMEISALPKLPETWNWITPEEISSPEKYSIGIGPFGSNLKVSDYKTEGIPLVFVKNITRNNFSLDLKFITENKFRELSAHAIKPLDIVITKMGDPPGDCAIYPENRPAAVITSDCLKFRIWDKYANRKYFKYCIETDIIKKQLGLRTKGVAQKKISSSRFKTILFPFTELEEQNEIVRQIESRLSVADKMEESISQSLQQAEALRQSILKKAFEGKLIKEQEVHKPKNVYFYQTQTLGYISYYSNKHNIEHGEMTIAKYAYLLDKIYNIATYYDYKRWHLGPYPPEMKKILNNKEFFNNNNGKLEVADTEKLLKYNYSNKEKVASAIDDLATIFGAYSKKDRSHKTELLATVCKVIEDIQSTDLLSIRQSMKEWKIDLPNSVHKNKAEKFNEEETKKCVEFIVGKGWDKKLLD